MLADENIQRFKDAALARAKEFDITNILPMYERFYQKIKDTQEQEKIKN